MKENSTVLLFGGVSEEKLVSTASAQNFSRFLPHTNLLFIDPEGRPYEVTKDELSAHKDPFKNVLRPNSKPMAPSLKDLKKELQTQVVLLALHGTEGEDGHLQKFFEENNIFYTGSDSRSSALCFDKLKAKMKAKQNQFPLAEELSLPAISKSKNTFEQIENNLTDFFQKKKKIVVKPVANGSSFGLHIISNTSQLQKALLDLKKNTTWDYMAEEFIQGRELTVGIYQRKGKLMALPPSEVILESGHNFDYNGKYLGQGSKEVTPADITAQQTRQAQELALKAHQIFGCYGYSRTDMILTDSGPYFLETNTLPGMTKSSFFPQQLDAAQLSFQEFVDEMIELAEKR